MGDTDLHAPCKHAIRKAFFLWYSLSVEAMKEKEDEGLLSSDRFTSRISQLLTMGVLRNDAPGWASTSVASIEKGRGRKDKSYVGSSIIIV